MTGETINTTGRLLLRLLRHPEQLAEVDLRQWNLLIPLAEATGVLSRLAKQAEQRQLGQQIPAVVEPHLLAARLLAARQDCVIRWEVNRLRRALAAVDTPIVLLKGAAYLLSGREAARGRLCSDTDILVPREKIAEVEQALLQHGWQVDEDNPYHEEYFRRWLHELPPLRHRRRKTLLDVHHTILPRTDRLRLDPALLFERAQTIDGPIQVLAPPDMVLHSAAHLFRNGDFTHSLRDLVDLDLLVREFSCAANFWSDILERAGQLDLRLPCYCALRYAERFCGTSIPDGVQSELQTARPARPALRVIDSLVERSLWPRRLDGVDRMRDLAIGLLAYWPIPRLRAMASGLFWLKRIPWPARARA